MVIYLSKFCIWQQCLIRLLKNFVFKIFHFFFCGLNIMTINAVLPTGAAVPLAISPQVKVSEVMDLLTKRFGIPHSEACLLFDDEILYDFFTLEEYSISFGSTIYVGLWVHSKLVIAQMFQNFNTKREL